MAPLLIRHCLYEVDKSTMEDDTFDRIIENYQLIHGDQLMRSADTRLKDDMKTYTQKKTATTLSKTNWNSTTKTTDMVQIDVGVQPDRYRVTNKFPWSQHSLAIPPLSLEVRLISRRSPYRATNNGGIYESTSSTSFTKQCIQYGISSIYCPIDKDASGDSEDLTTWMVIND